MRETRKAKRMLVVTVTKGFRHDTIPMSESVVQEMVQKSDGAFTVEYARTDGELQAMMTPVALRSYDAVLFPSTTGDLPLPDRDAFIAWIRAGHGFVGVHAAADTFHGYPPYIAMLGGEFEKHGRQVSVNCHVDDRRHPATRSLDALFRVFDEIYEFKNFERSQVHSLIHLDLHPQTGVPGYFPIAWTRSVGRGRVFYTALGHRDDIWRATWFRQHLQGGIYWALGLRAPR